MESKENKKRILEGLPTLTGRLGEYDAQFSMGRMLGRAVRAQMRTDVSVVADAKEFKEGEEDDQYITETLIVTENIEVLKGMGLRLETVEGVLGKAFLNGTEIEFPRLRLGIDNRTLFQEFLLSLEPNDLEDESIRGSFVDLLKVFGDQIRDNYEITDPSNQALNLYSSLGVLVETSKKIGLAGNDSYERLRTYQDHNENNTLREYLIVEKARLMNDPVGEGFNPSTWQIDATEDVFQRNWDRALDVLWRVRQNPNTSSIVLGAGRLFGADFDEALATLSEVNDKPQARALAHQLGKYLSDCLDFAQGQVNQMPDDYYPDNPNWKKEFMAILKAARERLHEIVRA